MTFHKAVVILTFKTSIRGWLDLEERGVWKGTEVHPALESLFAEIKNALDAELYYAAIAIAVSVPDICSWLLNDPASDKLHVNRRRQSKNYKAWFDANLATRFSNLTADDCYSIRCGVLHQGIFGRPDAQYDHIIFFTPQKNPQLGQIRMTRDVVVTIMGDVKFGQIGGRILQMEAVWFCEQIIVAAHEWALRNKDTPNLNANLPNLVRHRARGLPPYIVNVPVIA